MIRAAAIAMGIAVTFIGGVASLEYGPYSLLLGILVGSALIIAATLD